ncbi:hypothetical protein [Legionella jamestowniensis]|uniref:Uncharacterized protein n=1 Tax=Legionella jamestowniensis TaxID=455 RepID=Q49JA0_9GAMM|nr:hypothetical protein [Legionella jamestowniensis]AAX56176.1 unknown [Legionella jamestowniensis]KTD13327.1 hypothetical protein Ljam_0117 [Legionella jamestowniensis]OCH98354.1 hypothetical protein A8135_12425 [Legionella jamestowniensis]SFL77011.1 hypothetical protein SAMN02746073_1811 [Legionella jamestowniensis DSM 19215]
MPAPDDNKNKVFKALHSYSLMGKFSVKNENEKIKADVQKLISDLHKKAEGPLNTVTSIKKDENNNSAKAFLQRLQSRILQVVDSTAAAKLKEEDLNTQSKEKDETPSMPSTPGMG